MNTELRRSKRYSDLLAVSVIFRNDVNGPREVGPFAARIINISRHEICPHMSLGVPDTYNVYRSTCKNDSLHHKIQLNRRTG